MKFKDLKSGFTIYLLDKNNMTFSTEKVLNVSMPHIDAKMTAQGMVVDITTDKNTYCMSADCEIAYPSNKVITTEQHNILREVQALKATSEQALAQIEHHKENVSKCSKLIAELDPSQKEKQQMEDRMNNMEASINKMMGMLSKLTE